MKETTNGVCIKFKSYLVNIMYFTFSVSKGGCRVSVHTQTSDRKLFILIKILEFHDKGSVFFLLRFFLPYIIIILPLLFSLFTIIYYNTDIVIQKKATRVFY